MEIPLAATSNSNWIESILTSSINKRVIDIATPGGHLAVSFELKEDIFTDIWLEGPASYVFKGTFSI